METDVVRLQDQAKQRFASLAVDPASEKRFEIGRSSALKLGYDALSLDALPRGVVDSFAGVGCPLSLAPLREGMIVLDVGCGAGVDAMVAAKLVGHAGKVVGVDMTDEMVAKARRACKEAGLTNVEIRKGVVGHLRLDDESVDVVISNGVINLCPDKERVVGELYRVLKPGGRLQVADMSLVEGVNPEFLERVGEWSD